MGIISKINWKKVAKIGSCIFTGVMAYVSAVSDQKQAAKIVELESRLSNLETK